MEISFPLFFWGKKILVVNIKISGLYINIQTSDAFENMLSSMGEVEERLLPVVRPGLSRVQHGHLVLVSYFLPPGALSL